MAKNNILLLKDLKLQFCTKDEMCIGVSEYSLPIICDDFPTNFNEEEYFKVSFIIIKIICYLCKYYLSKSKYFKKLIAFKSKF